ncbi:MAG: glycosyltransferase, partial [Pseudonocardiaceae bacterium]
WLGRPEPTKGFDLLADAFNSPALAGRNDYRLELHGPLDGAADTLGAIPGVHVGTQYRPEDLPSLLGSAHVGLTTSRFETFHRVTREYLSAGLAVIAIPAFGVADVIVDGVNGLVVSPADAAGLARAIVRVLDDRELLNCLRRGATDTEVRTVDDEIDQLEELYRTMLRPSDCTSAATLAR